MFSLNIILQRKIDSNLLGTILYLVRVYKKVGIFRHCCVNYNKNNDHFEGDTETGHILILL